jgi:hypothetical protein
MASAYDTLMNHLDTWQFKLKLRQDPGLWVQADSLSSERMDEEDLASH